MNSTRKFGNFVLYSPFIFLLIMHVRGLYENIAIDVNQIGIWYDSLFISATLGSISSMMVLNCFNKFLTGTIPNIITDIFDESNQTVTIKYNGIFGLAGLMIFVITCTFLYNKTESIVWVNSAKFAIMLTLVLRVATMLASYIKINQKHPGSSFTKFSWFVYCPSIFFILHTVVVKETFITSIIKNLHNPQNTYILILVLIIILCYFCSVVVFHFANIYCLVGFLFLYRDPSRLHTKMKNNIDAQQKQKKKLLKMAAIIDEPIDQVGIIKKVWQIIRFLYVQLETYCKENIGSLFYLFSFMNFKIVALLHSLLQPQKIRIAVIRFCCITAVLELLALDIFLFIYLESNDPCLKFFELLSTVVIIPVLLSWLGDLKTTRTEA